MATALTTSASNIFNVLQTSEIYSNHSFNSFFPVQYWKNHSTNYAGLQDLIKRLQLSKELECHDGCVNTVRWNYNGTKIVSGSDDTKLGVWQINPHHSQNSKLLSKFVTDHTANIFHALFIPETNDDEIISCALDGDVRYNIISREKSNRIGTHGGSCHKLDIINKTTFVSCSEDGTIKLIDLRDKSTINTTTDESHIKNIIIQLYCIKNANIGYNPNINNNKNGLLYKSLPSLSNEHICCYTMTLNPLNNNIIAVGCRDKWIRLYDRRKLSIGDGTNAKPFQIMTQHKLLHKKEENNKFYNEDGVTGLAWSYDGSELAASYSQKNIALFNLYDKQTCINFETCQYNDKCNTKKPSKQVLDFIKESDDDDDDEKTSDKNNNDNNDNTKKSLLTDDVKQFLEDSDNDIENKKNETLSKTSKLLNDISQTNNNNIKNAVSKITSLVNDQKNKIKNFLMKNYNKKSIDYSLESSQYEGHRTVETVKECNFLGPRSEYIVSGSDCGHIFIWDKLTGKIINYLKGDNRITNVVQGNPFNSMLVSSGLDDTVKLFTPTKDIYNNLDKLNELINENKKQFSSNHLTTTSIPMEWLLLLYRRGILLDSDINDDSNDDNNDNNNSNNDDEDDDDDDDDQQNNETTNDENEEDTNANEDDDDDDVNYI